MSKRILCTGFCIPRHTLTAFVHKDPILGKVMVSAFDSNLKGIVSGDGRGMDFVFVDAFDSRRGIGVHER